MIYGKRGSATAEAAVVFPLVILAVLAAVYILISLYGAAAVQARIHIELRREAGTLTDTVYTYGQAAEYRPADKFGDSAFSGRIAFFEEDTLTRHRLSAQILKRYGGQGGLLGVVQKYHNGEIEIIDEESTIRQVNFMQYKNTRTEAFEPK